VQSVPKASQETSQETSEATGQFSLWAVHPDQGRRIAELYPSKPSALERQRQLESQGYDVLVTPADFTDTLGRLLSWN